MGVIIERHIGVWYNGKSSERGIRPFPMAFVNMEYFMAKGILGNKRYRRIHLAVSAIENGARLMHIPGVEMYRRLKAQDLIHNRLFARYDDLHSQSMDWVAHDTVETLKNWEAEER